MTPPLRRILVVGGGPAGSTTAYWLAKAGFEVVIAERSKNRNAYGQGIDLAGPAVQVVERMGLLGKIKSQTTGEEGFAILDDEGEEIGVLGRNRDENRTVATLTREIEIMRGSLARILGDAAEDMGDVAVRFGCTVERIEQEGGQGRVVVKLSDREEAEEFMVVVGADGIRSQVRRLAFEEKVTEGCWDRKGLYIAFYSIPGEKSDVPNAKLQQATRGRAITIRPIDREPTRSSCYCCVVRESETLAQALRDGPDAQRAALLEEFADVGGLGERARQGIRESADLYFEELVQIKLPIWHSNRCVLVGDSAYSPSPLTGKGTAVAILGSYVLAGELAANPDDPPAAFAKYEEKLRPYIAQAQTIPLWGAAPRIINPQSALGVTAIRSIFKFLAWSGVWKYISLGNSKKWSLEDYDFKLA